MQLERLADEISQHGPRHVFGVPGSGRSLELIDALDKRGVAFHCVYHESAAAIMAGTLSRMGAPTGVAISIKGPGLASMTGGLVACALEGFPLVAVAEAFGPEAPAGKAHKRIDHAALVSAAAKGARYLADDGPAYTELAGWAAAEAPAPVLLELADGAVEAEAIPARAPASEPGDAGALVKGAKRPIVIAGTAALRAGYAQALSQLRVPVFTTAAAKGLIDERLPQAAGVYTGVGLELTPEHALVGDCDLVVGIGLRAGELLRAEPFPVAAVNVDVIDAAGCDDFAFLARTASAEPILEALSHKDWGGEETAAAAESLRTQMLSRSGSLPAHALAATAEALGSEARLVVDTGYFCTIAEHAWQASDANGFLSSGAGRFMGIGLPQALAAALHDPSVPTVLAVGDGGIAPFFAEARLAVRERLPLVVLHMSDGGYGSVRTRAIKDGLIQRPLLETAAPWERTFQSIGFETAVLDDAEVLAQLLRGWHAEPHPLFVSLTFDPQAYQDMVKGIR